MQLINNTQTEQEGIVGWEKVLSLLQQDISWRLTHHDDGLQRQRDRQGNCQVMQSAATQEDGGGGRVGMERALPRVYIFRSEYTPTFLFLCLYLSLPRYGVNCDSGFATDHVT